MIYLKRIIFINLFLLQTAAFAQNSCSHLFDSSDQPPLFENASVIYSKMTELHKSTRSAIAEQDHYKSYIKPTGGGPCASVTAFNLLQGLRFMNHMPLLNAHHVLLKAYSDIPVLTEGRVSNGQMLYLLENFFENYMDKTPIQIKIQVADTHLIKPDEPAQERLLKWTPSILNLKDKELKILAYTVSQPSGVLLGRHFVILKNMSDKNRLTVLDPNDPLKDTQYDLIIDEKAEQPISIKLIKPNSTISTVVLTVDSIFTVQQ